MNLQIGLRGNPEGIGEVLLKRRMWLEVAGHAVVRFVWPISTFVGMGL
jgi:hypothetical protein